MARSLPLQIYVSRDLTHRVRLAAANRRLSVSEYVRALILAACDGEDTAGQIALTVERMHRQSVFIMVGVDAILAGHSDRALRDRAHQAYARRCKQLGIASTALEGVAK